nr:hypothetical protein [uncultured Oscillibacter sp.]
MEQLPVLYIYLEFFWQMILSSGSLILELVKKVKKLFNLFIAPKARQVLMRRILRRFRRKIETHSCVSILDKTEQFYQEFV